MATIEVAERAHGQRPLRKPVPSTKSDSMDDASASSSADPRAHSQPFPRLADAPTSKSPSQSSSKSPKNGLVTVSMTATGPGKQAIRRKPLSPSASPVAARYSSGAYLALKRSQPHPDQRYSRSFSVESPTLYEFPLSSIETIAGLRTSATWPVDVRSTSMQEHAPMPARETKHASRPISSALSPAPLRPGPSSQLAASPSQLPSLHTTRAAGTASDGGLACVEALLEAAVKDSGRQIDDEDDDEDDDDDTRCDHILEGYSLRLSPTHEEDNFNYNYHAPVPPPLASQRKAPPPRLLLTKLDTNWPQAAASPQTTGSGIQATQTPNTDKPLPKSPRSSKHSSSLAGASPQSDFSDQAYSPFPSSTSTRSKCSAPADASSPFSSLGPPSLLAPSGTFAKSGKPRSYCESALTTPPARPATDDEIDEMEDELRAISTELAASIRRELDLEDLVDRLQAEQTKVTSPRSKRTSDYFSDSGYSSAKSTEFDNQRDAVEKLQRRAEQEKATIRLELTDKLRDERAMRHQLDEQIKELSQKAAVMGLAQSRTEDATSRIAELERTCDNLRRKLADQHQATGCFEELLVALKGELRDTSNERDNLRDEIVPQLRARVDGLESQASELEKMTYESTKLQQEVQSLKMENTTLKKSPPRRSIASIVDESSCLRRSSSLTSPSPRPCKPPSLAQGLSGGMGSALSRSKTVRGIDSREGQAVGLGLTRSMSVKTTETRDALSDRLKDVEAQRDALHRALKALLERQECQNRENDKRVRLLEAERDGLLASSTCKTGFVKEVSDLRDEISALRRRSEDALEQKWQVEKGLAGLKMDLDRAEQEIAALRSLLAAKDILIPDHLLPVRTSVDGDAQAKPVTSQSLSIGLEQLKGAYAESLERIKMLQLGTGGDDNKIRLALQKLQQSLDMAVSSRDLALQEASHYKAQLEALKAGEQAYLQSEKALGDELQESARRIEELAVQVRHQLATNQNLRQRLDETAARGESEHRAHSERITAMQARLRDLEDQVVAAQTASEERVARHEEELAAVKQGHSQQLSRLEYRPRSAHQRPGRVFGPGSALVPMLANGQKRLRPSRADGPLTVAQETGVDALRKRVVELEKALADADREMEEVVSRMNTAQIEVLTLQEEREAAVNEARKLERALRLEKEAALEDRFKTLQS